MGIVLPLRKALFLAGVTTIFLSILLKEVFPRDVDPTPVPEPDILALMGIGGAVAVLVSLLRRRDK